MSRGQIIRARKETVNLASCFKISKTFTFWIIINKNQKTKIDSIVKFSDNVWAI